MQSTTSRSGTELQLEGGRNWKPNFNSTQRAFVSDDLIYSLEYSFGVNPKDLVGVKKPSLSLIPPTLNVHLAMAYKDGASKYGAYNWRENKVSMMTYLDAILRHVAAVIDREDVDSKSGVDHLAHAGASVGIILDAKETGNLIDDRPPKGNAADVIRRFTTC